MEPQFQSDVSSTLGRLAERCFIGALFLLPIVAIPLVWFPFTLFKVGIFSVLLFVGVLLAAAHFFSRGYLVLPKSYLLLAVIALPIAYSFSSLFSQNETLSFIGNGSDANTVFFVSLYALTALVGSVLLYSRRGIIGALSALGGALIFVAVFQILQIAFGPDLFGLRALSSLSSNLVGKWNDFGLMMGLLAVLATVAIDVGRLPRRASALCWIVLMVSVGLLSIVNLNTTWWVLVGIALITGIVALVTRDASVYSMEPRTRTIPYASLVLLMISAFFIPWGNQINTAITSVVPVTELEVRPAFSTTYEILKSTYGQSIRTVAVGTGPGTFVEQWLMYKPGDVNITPFWNLDFIGGSGVIPTAFITTGVLGGIIWICIIVLLCGRIIRSVRADLDTRARALVLISSIGALFLFVSFAMYLSGVVPLLVAFCLIAITLAAQRITTSHEYVLALREVSVVRRSINAGLVAICIVATGAVAVVAIQHLAAGMFVGRALTAPTGEFVTAHRNAERALNIYTDDDTLRLRSSLFFAQAQAISDEDSSGNADQSARFQSAFADAVKYAQAAIAADPRDYQNYALAGQLFGALVPLNVAGAYDSGRQYYVEAIKRNPYNPGLFLAAARMEAQAGNEGNFRQAIQSAFSVKPNYTEAALLVVQVEVARNNIDGAIVAAEVAAKTAPQNPGILFQLGLLKYAKGDANGARDAFEQALKLQPDYANAKYFLGLTYEKLDRTQEGIALFRDLRTTNPDNAEVKLILENMEAGRDPFESASSPMTPNPETRDTPPINE